MSLSREHEEVLYMLFLYNRLFLHYIDILELEQRSSERYWPVSIDMIQRHLHGDISANLVF